MQPKSRHGKVPPHNNEAEQAVLACLLIDDKVLDKVFSTLATEDFYHPAHRYIYSRILKLNEKNKPVDVVTLVSSISDDKELEKAGGIDYISSLVDIIPNSANVMSYATSVKDFSTLRALISLTSQISENCYDNSREVTDIVEEAEKQIFSLAEKKLKSDVQAIGGLINSTFEVLEKLYRRKDQLSGIDTGFTDLNKLTNGLQNSDLIIMAGRPGMGKTAFSLNVALNASSKADHSVAFFSLEMSSQQLVQRLLSAQAHIESNRLRSGRFSMEEWQQLATAAGGLNDLKLFIDDTPAISSMELRAKCRRLKREHGLDLVIVDYLQLMSATKGDNREQQISEISRSLKALAKELDIPIIALSQLNRGVESRPDKRPLISDLRESGAIEQDADVIIFLYRDEVYDKNTTAPGQAEVIVAKHRNGPTDTVHLTFQKEYMEFKDIADKRFIGGV